MKTLRPQPPRFHISFRSETAFFTYGSRLYIQRVQCLAPDGRRTTERPVNSTEPSAILDPAALRDPVTRVHSLPSLPSPSGSAPSTGTAQPCHHHPARAHARYRAVRQSSLYRRQSHGWQPKLLPDGTVSLPHVVVVRLWSLRSDHRLSRLGIDRAAHSRLPSSSTATNSSAKVRRPLSASDRPLRLLDGILCRCDHLSSLREYVRHAIVDLWLVAVLPERLIFEPVGLSDQWHRVHIHRDAVQHGPSGPCALAEASRTPADELAQASQDVFSAHFSVMLVVDHRVSAIVDISRPTIRRTWTE